MRYAMKTGLALLFAATMASAPAMARDHGRDRDRDNGRYSHNDDRGRHDDRGRDRYDDRRDYAKHDRYYNDRRGDHNYRPAPPRVVYRPAYRSGYGYGGAPRWSRGHRYDYRGYGPTYVVNNYHGYGLRPPPRGYYWRRSDAGDFLLVAVATGIISDLILRH